VAEQPGLGFADLLRQLRAGARLTQEELAEAAGLSSRSVSDLERGIHRTAHKDTAVLLADALGLTGPTGELFVAAARGKAQASDVLAAARGAGAQRLRAVTGSPYRGLSAFQEQDARLFFGRDAATSQVLERMSRLVAGGGLLVVSGVSGAGKSSLLRRGCCRGSGRLVWRPRRGRRRGRGWCSPRPGCRWMSWRCGWACWPGRTRRWCGAGWRPHRPGSR
jgi:transcriptional regulator with XRE-family HTH domain